ncbi:MAG: hypothetical protein LBR22_02580 [Desulfovibrio sp.]|jgi:DNA polymerase-3 subunit delta|nr:hypothetical protein [Desulfovibrio sp.]
MARPGFNILLCPDPFLVMAEVARLMEAHPPEEGGSWERRIFWGDEAPDGNFWDTLLMRGMFGGQRVIVVRNAHLWKKKTWEGISQALARPLPHAWPMLCIEAEWEWGRMPKCVADISPLKFWSFADGKGWRWTHGGLVDRMPAESRRGGVEYTLMRTHVQARARALGLALSQDAMECICSLLAMDAGIVESELVKLRAYCGPRKDRPDTVTVDMVSAMYSTAEVNTFGCLNAIEAGNLANVWREVARNAGDVSFLFKLMSMIENRFKTMWDILVEDSLQGVQPFVLKTLGSLAARLGLEGVARGLTLIVETELKLKSGALQDTHVLDHFLINMTLLCGQGPRGLVSRA